YDRIAEKKMQTSIAQLCAGYPQEFSNYLNYVRSLRFDDKPDYPVLRSRFRELLAKEGGTNDFIFDWNIKRIQECVHSDEAARRDARKNGATAQPSEAAVTAGADSEVLKERNREKPEPSAPPLKSKESVEVNDVQ
ncbi:Casein kinase I isoform delta-like, partial [Diplonema papillatum]